MKNLVVALSLGLASTALYAEKLSCTKLINPRTQHTITYEVDQNQLTISQRSTVGRYAVFFYKLRPARVPSTLGPLAFPSCKSEELSIQVSDKQARINRKLFNLVR
jgi:hypothetical protein